MYGIYPQNKTTLRNIEHLEQGSYLLWHLIYIVISNSCLLYSVLSPYVITFLVIIPSKQPCFTFFYYFRLWPFHQLHMMATPFPWCIVSQSFDSSRNLDSPRYFNCDLFHILSLCDVCRFWVSFLWTLLTMLTLLFVSYSSFLIGQQTLYFAHFRIILGSEWQLCRLLEVILGLMICII